MTFKKGQPSPGKPFKKGQSGNPNGRPVTVLTERQKKFNRSLREAILDLHEQDPSALAKAMWAKAMDGDVKAQERLCDFALKGKAIGKPLLTKTASDIGASEDVVLDALSTGEIDVVYAESLLKALKDRRDTVLLVEAQALADSLEKRYKG